MIEYTLALKTGGLMEDPSWHYDNARIVQANSIREAKQKYAEMTGLTSKKSWNPETQTYWGWEIVGVSPLKEIEYKD